MRQQNARVEYAGVENAGVGRRNGKSGVENSGVNHIARNAEASGMVSQREGK